MIVCKITLPASYTGGNPERVTSGAANAMLGSVYMQKGDYTSAKAALEKVVKSGLYHL
jgi:Tfp pilus assembly protein PilF